MFCRILSDCVGAEWPLSRKFGCEPAMAVDVLEHALKLGLEPHGVSFHVGSQQRNQHAWDRALASAAAVFKECGERGMNLAMVNLGGGFPTKYLKNVPTVKTYGNAIFKALRKHFGNRIPETIIEPGRGMVGNAGIIEAEVVLVSKKSEEDDVRWVYLDIGKFGGLAETMDESIRYPIRTPRDGDAIGALRARRPDLQFGRRAVREGALHAPGQPGDRRQGADRGHRRLYGDLLVGGLQRLLAAEDLPHLTTPGGGQASPPLSQLDARSASESARLVRKRSPQRSPAARDGEGAMAMIHDPPRTARRRRGARGAARRKPSARRAFASPRERLREGRLPAEGLSFVATTRGRLVGTARLWDIACGAGKPALLLGPLAVEAGRARPRHRRRAGAARDRAKRAGSAMAPSCWSATRPTTAASAFRRRKRGSLRLPGPFERHRLLALELVPGALDGAKRPARAPRGRIRSRGPSVAVARLIADAKMSWTPRANRRGFPSVCAPRRISPLSLKEFSNDQLASARRASTGPS